MTLNGVACRAMDLWKIYAKKYQNNPKDYQKTKEELRRLKLPIRELSVSTIRDYPDIEFLRITNETEAINYITVSTSSEVDRLVLQIEGLQFNYSFNTLDSYLVDARWMISRYNREKNNKSSGRTYHYRGYYSDGGVGGKKPRVRSSRYDEW